MIRKVLHIVERNKEKCEEEEGSLELVQPLLDEFSELNTEEKRVNAFTYFTRVVGTNKKSELLENPSMVVDAMNEMNLGKREKGSKQGICKFNTLLGRYFNGSVKKEPPTIQDSSKDNEDCSIEIKRGSVVALNYCQGRAFVVTVIWRVDGSKKWFPSIAGDNPSWKVGQNDDKYCIGVREVDMKRGEIIYKQGIEDVINRRGCYRQIVLSNITLVFGEVDV